jgi:uncharacterized protein YdaU (DUF1376 family)
MGIAAASDIYAPPAFQFYATDFLSDAPVIAMTLEERGAFITLLCIAWTEEGIPADHKKLAKLLRVSARKFAEIWEAMEVCWHDTGEGRYVSRKLEGIREEMRARSKSASEAGARGARARWGSGSEDKAA